MPHDVREAGATDANTAAAWRRAMHRGDYAAAWMINDAVLAARDPATRDDPRLPYHLRWVWDGRRFDGRNVLVRCYHGLGDTLLFARYLPALARRAASVTVEAQPDLLPVLAGLSRAKGPSRPVPSASSIRFVPFAPDAPLKPLDCDIEIMELPHALRLPPEAMPVPYLHIPAAPSAPGTVGLCWRAGGGGWDPTRALPEALLRPVTSMRLCVSLQPGPTSLAVRNPEGCPAALEDTAALIGGLDLVITVDTMVAHLAGALGQSTWLLLKHDADWRWMEGRLDSPWYASMRLYRQTAPGDWQSVVARVAADLGAAA
jgi:hypothetical protein